MYSGKIRLKIKKLFQLKVLSVVNKHMDHEMKNAFNAILDYKMTDREAEAYKLAIMYQEEFQRAFPPSNNKIDGATYRRNTISKKGDPRKCNLFRYCWKLLRESRGLLPPDERRLYVRAQITSVGNKTHAHLEPNILCGDRAWWRWKIYKWLLEKKLAAINSEAPPPSATTTDPKVAKELVFTKKFIFERCEGEPTQEKMEKFVENNIIKLWIMQGKISKFYMLLSPWMKEHKERLAAECSFDLKLFESKISNHIEDYFKHEFQYEF